MHVRDCLNAADTIFFVISSQRYLALNESTIFW